MYFGGSRIFTRRIEPVSTTEAPVKADELTQEMLAKMEEHGITRFPVYYFRFGQYTYSSLSYAIAQAERERSAG